MLEKQGILSRDVPVVRVFTVGQAPVGGNPAPVWLDADGLAGDDMQALAKASGREMVFVCAPQSPAHRWRMRYFVPRHEMEMCGHATIAALWLLHGRGDWDGGPAAIDTLGGTVRARKDDQWIQISQPPAAIQAVDDRYRQAIADCLGLAGEQILGPILNASTSRPKTLIRLPHAEALHALQVRADEVEALCERIGSTGLYPFAMREGSPAACSARQFPKSSGYVEDPATGIAATALAWGLRHLALLDGAARRVGIDQGEAMGSPSRIVVSLPAEEDGPQAPCWVGGNAVLDVEERLSLPGRKP